jgi:hypothetical protein
VDLNEACCKYCKFKAETEDVERKTRKTLHDARRKQNRNVTPLSLLPTKETDLDRTSVNKERLSEVLFLNSQNTRIGTDLGFWARFWFSDSIRTCFGPVSHSFRARFGFLKSIRTPFETIGPVSDSFRARFGPQKWFQYRNPNKIFYPKMTRVGFSGPILNSVDN